MKRIWILFVSMIILYTPLSMAQTSGSALQANTGKYSTDNSPAASSFGCKVYPSLTQKDSIYRIRRGSQYQTLQDFWPAFQKAIQKNDRKAMVVLTHFPLPGVAPFIHADMSGGLGADTAQFIAALPEIFAAIPRIRVLATSWDGLLPLDREDFGREISGSEILLLTVDKDSKIYLCHTQWTENNGKANNQAFVFAKINGSYKLCGITWRGGIY